MATTSDKMQTDYLWVKDHSAADSWAMVQNKFIDELLLPLSNKKNL